MQIETNRLTIIPLDSQNLAQAIDHYQELEKNIGVKVTDKKLDEEMQYAMGVRLKKVLLDERNYLWLTNWAIVLKEDNCIIGYIMIKGFPNELGEVIVGYGVDEEFRCKGYASEALRGLSEWIFCEPKAKRIIADTEKENIGSHRVLEKVGAVKYKETDELIWWEVIRNKMK